MNKRQKNKRRKKARKLLAEIIKIGSVGGDAFSVGMAKALLAIERFRDAVVASAVK